MTKKYKYFSRKTKDGIRRYIMKIIDILKKPEMAILPGQLAFFMLLSAVPIITLCGYGVSLFNVNTDSITKIIYDVVPGGADLLQPLFNGLRIDTMLIIVLIWMFYIASNGFNSVILASNEIYGIKHSNFVKRRIKAILMTFATVIVFILLLLIPVFGNKILTLLHLNDFNTEFLKIYSIIKGPLIWLILFIFIRTIYEFAPDRMRKKTHVNTGAFFTSICWVIVTSIYSQLANNMTNYSIIYGTLSNIAFLMMWLYFMSLVFVVGLSLNYGEEIDKETMDKTGAVKVVKG